MSYFQSFAKIEFVKCRTDISESFGINSICMYANTLRVVYCLLPAQHHYSTLQYGAITLLLDYKTTIRYSLSLILILQSISLILRVLPDV